MTVTVHQTRQLEDHAQATTLCGKHVRTDREATQHVKATQQWVSCPLCETVLVLAEIGIEPDMSDTSRRQSPGWTQPDML
ncbi:MULTISPECIES: hypothetical protein [unclassified Bifidobacterium]|uniref:hypothetical protein n=1 Tax=unclassified Bifidobacterium TaxID=2608897 RepID=UPI00112713F3|nr:MULTISPECIES: hypothetical protein [unclassified Bifidobacterium]TPF79338.1 hypothetical protein BW08_10570 [Bifidobacterium sp. UTCIF-24]TPF84349.1 hypothetical protein BW07_05125 [Bifidobacterium sp. UTCIF-36]TPF91034.1 hypothetical protein BW10_02110 [Bifidobacterium sp. UTBIF-56]